MHVRAPQSTSAQCRLQIHTLIPLIPFISPVCKHPALRVGFGPRVCGPWVVLDFLWTFCSSHQPLRKHSIPSGAGTGRLRLERYRVFKNKGTCFPFAADLSTEIVLLQSCKCFRWGCWEGVSNFLPAITRWFPVCRDSYSAEKRVIESKWGGCFRTSVLECTRCACVFALDFPLAGGVRGGHSSER